MLNENMGYVGASEPDGSFNVDDIQDKDIPIIPKIDYGDSISENEAIGVENVDTEQENSDFEKMYDFSSARCVKTSERILDDLRVDPLFLLKSDDGMLSYPTFAYSSALSQLMKSNEVKYNAVFWNTNDQNFGSASTADFDDNSTLVKFTGLLVPNVPADRARENFTDLKIFHYSVSIKYKKDRIRCKNTFYGFKDEDIFEEDKLWIEPSNVIDDSDSDENENESRKFDIVLSSLPQIIDSANFVSKETQTVVRVDVYPAIFSQSDLESFSLTEIQTRIAKFNSQVGPSDVFNNSGLSSHECFSKLEKALKGPILQKGISEGRNINLLTSKLEINVDLQLLVEKFYFQKEFEKLCPIRFSDYDELHAYILENYFKRALQETIYFKCVTSVNNHDLSNTFSASFNDVFQAFYEFDLTRQIQTWNNWSSQAYSYPLLLLSSCTYYQDDLIRHIYETLTTFDPENIPLYYDALTYCATSRYSEQLGYYVTILKSSGVVGFEELKGCFKVLGFNIENLTCKSMQYITDEQLLDTYKNQIIVSTSKVEKQQFREKLEKIANFRSSVSLTEYLNTEPFFDIFDAYRLLDIDRLLDDSLLITFYDYKANENGRTFDSNVARAFYTICLERKSILLMTHIDNNLPQFSVSNISLSDAYKMVGVMETAEDLQIIRIFQERIQKDVAADFKLLWKSLKLISQSRNSKLIEGYLTSGVVNSTLLEVGQTPAGLNNIGNTCYLNSLLQYYFVIEPLRDYILQFNDVFSAEKFSRDEKYQSRRIGGRTVGLKETERSYQFMYQLRDLYYQLIHENEKCVTPSRELAYLAFSPISFEVEFEEEGVNHNKNEAPQIESIDLTASDEDYQSLRNNSTTNAITEDEIVEIDDSTSDEEFHKSNQAETPSPNHTEMGKYPKEQRDEHTRDESSQQLKTAAVCKISPDQFECAFEIGSQQDVTECISNVLTQIESAMQPEKFEENDEQIDMVKTLFFGKTKQRLVPVDSKTKEEIPNSTVRTKVESFLNLIVNIGDHPRDIYDALDTYFTEDLLELDEGEVKRSLTIIELPNILQIQIQRVQFDRVRLIPVKSTEPIPFEEKIYMDRYLETEDPVIINKRKELFYWRRRVSELNEKKAKILSTNEQGMSARDVLKSTRDYLVSDAIKELGYPIDMNTLEVLDLEIERLYNDLNSINDELNMLQQNITNQFKAFDKIGYSIFAIFIHRGQASYGHYFIYIRDPISNVYRKYNDETVSEVSFEEIFNFSEGNTATPYYLSFIKDDLLDKITPLNRDILIKKQLESLENGSENITENGNVDLMELD